MFIDFTVADATLLIAVFGALFVVSLAVQGVLFFVQEARLARRIEEARAAERAESIKLYGPVIGR